MTASTSPIVIIVGTNRPNSMSRKIAEYYQGILQQLHAPSIILDLVNLPEGLAGIRELVDEARRSLAESGTALVRWLENR